MSIDRDTVNAVKRSMQLRKQRTSDQENRDKGHQLATSAVYNFAISTVLMKFQNVL